MSINADGYVKIRIATSHPRADPNGYAYVHDLVMEWAIGRHLHADESVHHRDGIRSNNMIDNLELHTRSSHARLHNALRERDRNGRFVSKSGITPKAGGNTLDGRVWHQFPGDVLVDPGA